MRSFVDHISLISKALETVRGGKRHKAQGYIRNKLLALREKQENNEPQILERRVTRAQVHEIEVLAPQAAAIKRANELYSNGYIGRAARALQQRGGLANISEPSVRAQMIAKHPEHVLTPECLQAIKDADRENMVVLADKHLHNLVASMDRGAAPGYDGLNARILLRTFRDPELFKLAV